MKGPKRLIFAISTIVSFAFLFSQCVNSGGTIYTATDSTYVGDKTCIQCHKNTYDNHIQNPHARASAAILAKDLFNGSQPKSNIYEFDEHFKIAVEEKDSGMYQTVYIDNHAEFSRRFDIAIGAGKNAITYGSWQGNNLYQMQLSYFHSIKGWANSPGYPNNRIHFGRIINTNCLECHASQAKRKVESQGGVVFSEELDKKTLIYGINCERCHGPSGRHAEFHIKNPQIKISKYITSYKSLTRKQKVDACAICHSGSDRMQRSTFQFKPGDKIEDFLAASANEESDPDVHGQQYQMLAGSKCYTNSKTLDCNTCHNIHEKRSTDLVAYSKKCISCHTTIKHSTRTLSGSLVKTNCIDCHMPQQDSKAIEFRTSGASKLSPYRLRTHLIKVYR